MEVCPQLSVNWGPSATRMISSPSPRRASVPVDTMKASTQAFSITACVSRDVSDRLLEITVAEMDGVWVFFSRNFNAEDPMTVSTHANSDHLDLQGSS